jgi:hypothetical protein
VSRPALVHGGAALAATAALTAAGLALTGAAPTGVHVAVAWLAAVNAVALAY